MADERDPYSLGGLKAITGQLMLCYHADFQLIFGCTVLVEGPLEHQTLHYGNTHCNTCAFGLIVFALPGKSSQQPFCDFSSFWGHFKFGGVE